MTSFKIKPKASLRQCPVIDNLQVIHYIKHFSFVLK
jgi:hypothetical protein